MNKEKLKFAAVMMIAVFLFSLVSLAFADEGSDDSAEADISAETDAKIAVTTSARPVSAEEKARIATAMRAENEKIKAAREQAKDAMEQEREKLKDTMEQKREAMKDSIESQREEMKQTRETAKETMKSMITERKEFMEKMKSDIKERHDTLELARKAKKENILPQRLLRF